MTKVSGEVGVWVTESDVVMSLVVNDETLHRTGNDLNDKGLNLII